MNLKIFALIFTLCIVHTILAQHKEPAFEGILTYKSRTNAYGQQFEIKVVEKIKGDNTLTITSAGDIPMKTITRGKEGKMYMMGMTDAVWEVPFDTVKKCSMEYTDIYQEINGYRCRKMIYTCEDFQTAYWVDESIPVKRWLKERGAYIEGLVVREIVSFHHTEYLTELIKMEKCRIKDKEFKLPKEMSVKSFEKEMKDMDPRTNDEEEVLKIRLPSLD